MSKETSEIKDREKGETTTPKEGKKAEETTTKPTSPKEEDGFWKNHKDAVYTGTSVAVLAFLIYLIVKYLTK